VGRQDLLIPEAEFRTALGARPHSKLVVLPASAPWMVPEEERYIRLLQSALKDFKSVGDVQIVVRINPMDGDGRLAEVLRADAPEIIVSKPDWRWDRKRNWCFQRRSDQVLYNSLLNYASACIGMPSTVTVECAVADVPIINIGFDLPGPAVQPGAVRKFWDADFYEEVRQTGAAKLVESPGNLAAAVEEALVHPELVRQSRHALLERQLGIAPHAAVDAAVQVLLETVKPELRPREGNAFYQCSRKEDPPLKTTITTLLLRLPGGRILLQKIRRYRFHKNLRKFPNSKAIFDYYYKTRFWGSAESVSGPGSTIQNTENARRGIANVIKRLQVRRLLDAPCGDYNWFRLIQRDKDVQYIGGDIVDSLIAENATKHGNQNTSFLPIDITHDPLPCADLWICRDVFLHFSYRDIFLTMNNFVRNNIQYLLTTSYINAGKNTDIPTGSARPVNLQLPPFNFCKPIEYINDYVEGQPVRCLCLWERKALLETLLHNREFQRLANDTNCLSTTAPRLRS
jgi:SAM-dependent methyltransferase